MTEYPTTGQHPWGLDLKEYIDAQVGGGTAVTSVDGQTGAVDLSSAYDGAGAAAVAQAVASQRSSHTGVQAQSTVSNLVADLAAKAADGGTVVDFNTAVKAGFYAATNLATNAPVTGQWWYLIVGTYSTTGYVLQKAIRLADYAGSSHYERQMYSTVWTPWVQVASDFAALDARYGILSTPVRFSADIPTLGTTGSDRASVSRTLTEARMRVGGAPSGSAMTVEVQHHNGTSWLTIATLTIAAGATTEAVVGLSQVQVSGNLLRLNVTSIGSATDVVVDVMTV